MPVNIGRPRWSSCASMFVSRPPRVVKGSSSRKKALRRGLGNLDPSGLGVEDTMDLIDLEALTLL